MPNFGTVGELASLLAKTGNAFIQVYRDETRSQALRTPEESIIGPVKCLK